MGGFRSVGNVRGICEEKDAPMVTNDAMMHTVSHDDDDDEPADADGLDLLSFLNVRFIMIKLLGFCIKGKIQVHPTHMNG